MSVEQFNVHKPPPCISGINVVSKMVAVTDSAVAHVLPILKILDCVGYIGNSLV